MFLKKENDYLILSRLQDIKPRYLKIIEQLINGNLNNDKIIGTYSQTSIENLLKYLKKSKIEFSLDQDLHEILNHIQNLEFEFISHSRKALEIKNNINDSNIDFLQFLNFISSNLYRKLYMHQAKAAFHMAFSLNSCNFSVPGTGKTTIVYAAYTYLKEMNKVDRLLIIGPLSSLYPWMYEYFECFNKTPDFMNLSELNVDEKKKYFIRHRSNLCELNFINYEGLSNINYEIKKFLDNGKTMLVLDEAHKIKNPNAKRSISTISFADKASSRIILTGTPIPNGYQDLYALFEFIWPKKNIVGFSLNELKRLTQKPNRDSVEALMLNIDPFYIRIKKEYLKLPTPKHNEPIKVQMGSIQKEIYDSLVLDFTKSTLSINDEMLVFELKKAKLMRLMQASTNPATIDLNSLTSGINYSSNLYEKINNYFRLETPEKFNTLLKLINHIKQFHKNKKVIVWSIFVKNIVQLSSFLKSNGIQNELLYGEINNDDRAEIIKRFHNEECLQVIIANPAAVSESISLHKACQNAIYLDKNFNAAQFIQSKDRIHRVGLAEKDEVNYYYFISTDTIESLVHQRLIEKEKMMLDIIEGATVPLFDDDFSSEISINDMKLLEEYFKKGTN